MGSRNTAVASTAAAGHATFFVANPNSGGPASFYVYAPHRTASTATTSAMSIDQTPDYEQNPRIPPHEKVPEDVDVAAAVGGWLVQANEAVDTGSAANFANLFHDEGWWRDRHSFTWTYRSLFGKAKIASAFEATYPTTKATNFVVDEVVPPVVVRLFPDLSFIQAHLKFETVTVVGSSVVNLVLVNGAWKAWTLSTLLEELKDFPEAPRPYGSSSNQYYAERRAAELNFEGQDPAVLILGAGQSGLSLAAQLQALSIPTLLVDKSPRVGDAWRNRYEVALSLHSPVHSDSLPFIPFPKHWPMYPGQAKLGQFFESYAQILDLNVWCSTTLISSSFDEDKQEWTVLLQQEGQVPRTLHPKHLVIATGVSGGVPNMPKISEADSFKGTILHSTEYKNAKPFRGQRVLVVGTASTGMDLGADLAKHGAHPTLLQRSPTYVMSLVNGLPLNGSALYNENGPPLEIADRISASMPYAVAKLLASRTVAQVAEKDKEMLDGLEKAGFRTWLGPDNAGHMLLGLGRGGGYYFDSGACGLIAAGKIGVIQGRIERFTPDGVILEDGSTHLFDAVVFATGFTSVRDSNRRALGSVIADKIGDCWGLNREHELQNTYVPVAHPNIYYIFFGFIMNRINGRLLARYIKASLNGVAGKPYTRELAAAAA